MASKYQNKKQKKSGKAAPAKSRVPGVPVFLYHSVCCGALAKKPACVKDYGVPLHERKATLGHWRCSQCRKACKVNRRLNKEGINPFRPVAATIASVVAALVSPVTEAVPA